MQGKSGHSASMCTERSQLLLSFHDLDTASSGGNDCSRPSPQTVCNGSSTTFQCLKNFLLRYRVDAGNPINTAHNRKFTGRIQRDKFATRIQRTRGWCRRERGYLVRSSPVFRHRSFSACLRESVEHILSRGSSIGLKYVPLLCGLHFGDDRT
jgi:hypothetical protein